MTERMLAPLWKCPAHKYIRHGEIRAMPIFISARSARARHNGLQFSFRPPALSF